MNADLSTTAPYRAAWLPPRGALLPFLLVFLLSLSAQGSVPDATAQRGGLAVRFEGNFSLGSGPAPVGSAITVITARGVNDVSVCGSGVVTGAHGEYNAEVQAIPYCAFTRSITVPIGQYIFIANGENVGGCSCAPSLDTPSALGRTATLGLRGAGIPGFQPASADYGPIMMPAVRFYGNLTLAGTPAPVGTAITVTTARSVADVTACGTGTVYGEHGEYSVDVPAIPYCAFSRSITVSIGRYIFSVNGENVGGCACLPSLDAPSSLGHSDLLGLRGSLPPAQYAPFNNTVPDTLPDGQPQPQPQPDQPDQ